MAWALVWEKAVDEGRSKALEKNSPGPKERLGAQISQGPNIASLVISREQPQDTAQQVPANTSTLPKGRGNPRDQTRGSTAQWGESAKSPKLKFEKVADLVMKLRYQHNLAEELKRGEESLRKTNDAREKKQIAPYLLQKMSDAAWEWALNTSSSPESNLERLAEQALNSAKAANMRVHLINLVSSQGKTKRPLWEGVFVKTWEKTWKKCWEAAWKSIMDETSKTVWDSGVREGIHQGIHVTPGDKQEPIDHAVLLSSIVRESYDAVKKDLVGGSSRTEHYWRIRSIFQALDTLHRAKVHSVHTSDHNVMKIYTFHKVSTRI
jgi:hypothetical protein